MFHVSTLLPFRQRTDELGQQWERKQHIGFASPRPLSLSLSRRPLTVRACVRLACACAGGRVRLACGVRGACSNDVVVIVYYEGTSQLDPAIFESQFNHVFAIVQPIPGSGTPHARVRRGTCAMRVCGGRVRWACAHWVESDGGWWFVAADPVSYRLHMAYKDGVATLTDVRPPLPARATLKHGPGLRDYLLTKRTHRTHAPHAPHARACAKCNRVDLRGCACSDQRRALCDERGALPEAHAAPAPDPLQRTPDPLPQSRQGTDTTHTAHNTTRAETDPRTHAHANSRRRRSSCSRCPGARGSRATVASRRRRRRASTTACRPDGTTRRRPRATWCPTRRATPPRPWRRRRPST